MKAEELYQAIRAKLDELGAVEKKATPPGWSIPHFSDDEAKCGCRYVLSEMYCGSVCEVDVNNGLGGEHNNDSPPPEEAKANGVLIPTLRNLAPGMLAYMRQSLFDIQHSTDLVRVALDKCRSSLPESSAQQYAADNENAEMKRLLSLAKALGIEVKP